MSETTQSMSMISELNKLHAAVNFRFENEADEDRTSTFNCLNEIMRIRREVARRSLSCDDDSLIEQYRQLIDGLNEKIKLILGL